MKASVFDTKCMLERYVINIYRCFKKFVLPHSDYGLRALNEIYRSKRVRYSDCGKPPGITATVSQFTIVSNHFYTSTFLRC